jgi:tRNA-(ms[2]io[6]A)-hydroxylase
MLSLQSTTSPRWLRQVDEHLDEILIDHAHCEKKAAGTAMNLMFAYVEDEELCREMTRIVNEELEHFHLVLDILRGRGVRFRRLKPSNYGRQLHELIRKLEPGRAVDRLLVAGLIEARSCERFDLLRKHLPDKELAEFFGSLFESEAGHHGTYVRLAGHFADRQAVRERLHELAVAEADIIARGDQLPRVHS